MEMNSYHYSKQEEDVQELDRETEFNEDIAKVEESDESKNNPGCKCFLPFFYSFYFNIKIYRNKVCYALVLTELEATNDLYYEHAEYTALKAKICIKYRKH